MTVLTVLASVYLILTLSTSTAGSVMRIASEPVEDNTVKAAKVGAITMSLVFAFLAFGSVVYLAMT